MAGFLSFFLGLIFFPITLIGGWITVKPQEAKIVLIWGNVMRIIKESGIKFVNPWGREIISVSTKQQTIDIHRTTVADANANPIIIAAVCTFKVIEPVKAALEVEDYQKFVESQAIAVLKQVAARYPYESRDGHSLKDETIEVMQEMTTALNRKVQVAGVRIISYEISDLTYAPEIAQAMLVRQQAQALVEARKYVVEGAVDIAYEALVRLKERGIKMDAGHQSKIVSNLLAIICGDANVQPTLAIQE